MEGTLSKAGKQRIANLKVSILSWFSFIPIALAKGNADQKAFIATPSKVNRILSEEAKTIIPIASFNMRSYTAGILFRTRQ